MNLCTIVYMLFKILKFLVQWGPEHMFWATSSPELGSAMIKVFCDALIGFYTGWKIC